MVNIDRDSVRRILIEYLYTKKFYAKIVPKHLTLNQKFNPKETVYAIQNQELLICILRHKLTLTFKTTPWQFSLI